MREKMLPWIRRVSLTLLACHVNKTHVLQVWTILPGGNTVQCQICSDGKTGEPKIMGRRFVAKHEATSRHQERHKRILFNLETRRIQQSLARASEKEQQPRDQQSPEFELCTMQDSPDEDVEALQAAENAEPDVADAEDLVPLSELWEVDDQDISLAPPPREEPLEQSFEDNDDALPDDEDMQLPTGASSSGGQHDQAEGESMYRISHKRAKVHVTS